MNTNFEAYLKQLGELTRLLAQLTETAQQKAAAVRADDLSALDACIKKEQAFSLSLRSMDKRREAMLDALGLSAVPLSGLADHAPADRRLETVRAVNALRDAYSIYSSASEAAKHTLEVNLHQIERVLYGEQPAPDRPKPPTTMRADIRA